MLVIFVASIFGAICAAIAAGKNRSAVGWFFIGLLLPLVGLIMILVLPRGEGGVSYQIGSDYGPPPTAEQLRAQNAKLERLQKLAELRDRGALTEQEFEQQKAEVLAA